MSSQWNRLNPDLGWQDDYDPDDQPEYEGNWPMVEAADPDPLDWENTTLYTKWAHRVKYGAPNDLIIAITPSSWTGVSGTGKTTAAVGIAKKCDLSPDGFDAESQASLDASEMAYEVIPEVDEGAALIFDEAQGAPDSDSVNARRGMKQSSMDALNAMLANRDNRNTVIIIGQQLGMLDKNLYPMIDAWLLIRREPSDPNGPLMGHYELHIDDFDLSSPRTTTPKVEDLRWPRVPKDDPDYRCMEQKKQQAKRKSGGSDDGDDGPVRTEKEWQAKVAQAYRDMGKSCRWIARNVDAVDYEKDWIRKRTEEPSAEEEEATA